MINQLQTGSVDGPQRLPYTAEEGGIVTELSLQRIVDACASNLAVLDESGRVLYMSSGWRKAGGEISLTADRDRLGLRIAGTCSNSTVSASTDIAFLGADIQRILDNREREFHKEYSSNRLTGSRWFLVHGARLDLPESRGFRVLVTREDITRRRRAEEELRTLGSRLIQAQEQEHSRLARELHDDLNQQMAVISIELDQLRQRMPKSDTELVGRANQLWNHVREISSEIHRISYQLHPAKLDHLGLAAAVRGLCNEFSEHNEIVVAFREEGFPAVLSPEIALCVFRIAQESLRNVVKHSGATEVEVFLKKTSRAISLRVSDKGCGFDNASPRIKKGLGFISMRERLRLVGGEISIRSQPQRGTRIEALVPLMSEADTQAVQ